MVTRRTRKAKIKANERWAEKRREAGWRFTTVWIPPGKKVVFIDVDKTLEDTLRRIEALETTIQTLTEENALKDEEIKKLRNQVVILKQLIY